MEASNWAFVTAAYVITWVLILGYVVYSQRALRRARAEYARVTGHAPGEGAGQ
ncbi:MAG TPA: CcmD family protein [Gemmatimonadaceae bacterium]|jgi:CcmD family protein|nr:CcmD family protein [Gemmatimonadaceae bacterium]